MRHRPKIVRDTRRPQQRPQLTLHEAVDRVHCVPLLRMRPAADPSQLQGFVDHVARLVPGGCCEGYRHGLAARLAEQGALGPGDFVGLQAADLSSVWPALIGAPGHFVRVGSGPRARPGQGEGRARRQGACRRGPCVGKPCGWGDSGLERWRTTAKASPAGGARASAPAGGAYGPGARRLVGIGSGQVRGAAAGATGSRPVFAGHLSCAGSTGSFGPGPDAPPARVDLGVQWHARKMPADGTNASRVDRNGPVAQVSMAICISCGVLGACVQASRRGQRVRVRAQGPRANGGCRC